MTAAATVQELERAGVLITEGSRRIGFRHHILFDYAVARLLLDPDSAAALDLVNKARAVGLLVAPSLGYWLERQKNVTRAAAYWSLISSLIADPEVDPIVRVEVARLAVESVTADERLDALLPLLSADAPRSQTFPRTIVSW